MITLYQKSSNESFFLVIRSFHYTILRHYVKDYKDKINSNFIKVRNGEELQKALDSDYNNLIYLEEGEYKLADRKIVIKKQGKHILSENKAVFINGLNIENNCKLTGVIFKIENEKDNIYIFKGAKVYIDKCEFIGFKNSLEDAIYIEENSNSKINVLFSSFNNFEKAIVINSGNIIENIENNLFQDMKIGIDNIENGAIVEDISKITKNSFVNVEKYAIGFSTGVNININGSISLVTDGINFARTLSVNNGYTYVNGDGIFEEIDSYVYEVENSNSLNKVLNDCNDGNIIRLKNGFYFGDFIIDKQIALIGENSQKTIIIPKLECSHNKPQYGIRIKSSNVLIKNIFIDGRGNFRDGIRYESQGGENNVFLNIQIKNVIRRGISIWPKTKGTIIQNCIFEKILEKQGIYFNSSGKIENCIFKNIKTGIEIQDVAQKEEIFIAYNYFKKNKIGIIINKDINNIKFVNNLFKNIEIGIDKK